MGNRDAQTLTLGVGTSGPKHIHEHREGPTVAFQLHDFEQVPVSAQALDSEGNPANVTYGWTSSDADVVAVTDNGDGTALLVASPGAGGLGTATITVTSTDVSDGDVIMGTLDVEVIAGDAVAVNIITGAVAPKP